MRKPSGVAGPGAFTAVHLARVSTAGEGHASRPPGLCASPSAHAPRVPLSRAPDLLLLPPSHFPKGVSLSSPSLTRLLISEAQMCLKPVSLSPFALRPRSLEASARQRPDRCGSAARPG